jgi:hypothetical protein
MLADKSSHIVIYEVKGYIVAVSFIGRMLLILIGEIHNAIRKYIVYPSLRKLQCDWICLLTLTCYLLLPVEYISKKGYGC